MYTVSRAALGASLESQDSDVTSPRQRAVAVSTATPRAAMTPAQAPARGEWA